MNNLVVAEGENVVTKLTDLQYVKDTQRKILLHTTHLINSSGFQTFQLVAYGPTGPLAMAHH